MKFTANEILKITQGSMLGTANSLDKFRISTDSRSIKEDEIFLPIVGLKFDGHDFIDKAIEKGCCCYFIDKKHEKLYENYKPSKFVILVKDTLEAYLKLASYYRKKVNPIVIGITGSAGKTTTKELLYSITKNHYKTHKSILNHNNEIGLCQTLLSMPQDTEVLIVEMGMRGLGEIDLLSKYAQPDIAIITNVGSAHIGRLGSIENIAKAKCEITNYLNEEGLLIAHDSPEIKKQLNWLGNSVFYSDENLDVRNQSINGSVFNYNNNDYGIKLTGKYNILNAIAAIEAGIRLGINPNNINSSLKSFNMIDKRWEVIELKSKAIIVNDSYNANPDSVKASVKSFADLYRGKNLILVIGNMEELGKFENQYHLEVGQYLNEVSIDTLIAVGNKTKIIANSINKKETLVKHFTKNSDVQEYLLDNLTNETVVLFKASRSMNFEEIVNGIKGKSQQ